MSTFRSLRGFDYRTWAMGSLVSNVGTWMQRTAQDWLVLTQLTHNSMRGRVMAIPLAIALGGTPIGAPLVGRVADRFGPRWALLVGAAGGFFAALIGIRHLLTREET